MHTAQIEFKPPLIRIESSVTIVAPHLRFLNLGFHTASGREAHHLLTLPGQFKATVVVHFHPTHSFERIDRCYLKVQAWRFNGFFDHV